MKPNFLFAHEQKFWDQSNPYKGINSANIQRLFLMPLLFIWYPETKEYIDVYIAYTSIHTYV